jgi:hypothetical protein
MMEMRRGDRSVECGDAETEWKYVSNCRKRGEKK